MTTKRQSATTSAGDAPISWGSLFQSASFSEVVSSVAVLLSGGEPLSPPFPPSPPWDKQGVPAWDGVRCHGLGLPMQGRSRGTWQVPGASFASSPSRSSLGTGSLWEPRLSPAGTPPSLGEGCGCRTDPTLFRVARAKAFPSRPWRRGSAPALPGDWGCQAGHSLAPEQPARHGELWRGRRVAWFHCASHLVAEVKRNYFPHVFHFLGEQIPPWLHLSCQSDLASLAEG